MDLENGIAMPEDIYAGVIRAIAKDKKDHGPLEKEVLLSVSLSGKCQGQFPYEKAIGKLIYRGLNENRRECFLFVLNSSSLDKLKPRSLLRFANNVSRYDLSNQITVKEYEEFNPLVRKTQNRKPNPNSQVRF